MLGFEHALGVSVVHFPILEAPFRLQFNFNETIGHKEPEV